MPNNIGEEKQRLTVSPDSPFYPYPKVYSGFYDLSEATLIPRKVIDYLLDMPDAAYMPKDDNKYPRTRLWKYLYYDGPRPDAQPLPTPQQKMEVLFNPEFPTDPPNKEKGYRLFPQMFVKPAQTDAQTRLYVYMGRTIATSDLEVQMSVVFEVWTNYTEESNTKVTEAYSRCLTITQAIMAALHGVNMTGVGSFYYNRSKHADCTDQPFTDKESNVGRRLIMGLTVTSDTKNSPKSHSRLPLGENLFLA